MECTIKRKYASGSMEDYVKGCDGRFDPEKKEADQSWKLYRLPL